MYKSILKNHDFDISRLEEKFLLEYVAVEDHF